MSPNAMADPWRQELEAPTEGFFRAFATRLAAPDGVAGAVGEALEYLVPRIPWQELLPQVPHALPGLASAFRLRAYLAEPLFRRLLATLLHALAREGQLCFGEGARKPFAIPDENPGPASFRALLPGVAADMANVGHKAVMILRAEDLAEALGWAPGPSAVLLGWARLQADSGLADRFWHQRMLKRIEAERGEGPASGRTERDPRPGVWAIDAPEAGEGAVLPGRLAPQRLLARFICDQGLVALLDAMAARHHQGFRTAELLPALAFAASERILDARRDLEGKTLWLLSYLDLLARRDADLACDTLPAQAAALVNFFPGEEPEDRLRPAELGEPPGEVRVALLDAILDAEPRSALTLASRTFESEGPEAVLRVLAEAAATNDPGPNHASQVLAVAAAVDLAPHLQAPVLRDLLPALAKSLANAQGSCELGQRARRALEG